MAHNNNAVLMVAAAAAITASGQGKVSAQISGQKSPPGYHRLLGMDALRLIRGAAIGTSDDSARQAAASVEQFRVDFTWSSTRQEILPRTKKGGWLIKDDLLCVDPELQPRYCREIWKTNNEGMIALRQTQSESRFSEFILYKIVRY